jgi:hypothetical protein
MFLRSFFPFVAKKTFRKLRVVSLSSKSMKSKLLKGPDLSSFQPERKKAAKKNERELVPV